MRLALALPLLLVVNATYAQPAQKSATHRIPFASTENTLELAVANTGAEVLDRTTIRLTSRPVWLTVSPEVIVLDSLSPGAEAVASFTFDVDRQAPLAESAEIAFAMETAGGLLWTKTIRLEVEAPRAFSLSAAYPIPSA